MTTPHPMDSVPMPEPAGAMDKDAGPFMFLGEEIGRLTDAVSAYSEEQLRAYGLSAYEMGRNAGLEEAAVKCESRALQSYEEIPDACNRPQDHSDLESHECAAQIREMKR